MEKQKRYYIKDVEEFLKSIDWDSELFDDVSGDQDEDVKHLDWFFNPCIEHYDLRDYGAEITVHKEFDLPHQYWGVTIRGDKQDVAESLADEYIGDSNIPEDMYNYIVEKFKDILPYFE